MKLYQLQEQIRAILDDAENPDANIDQLGKKLEKTQIDFDKKMESCACVLQELGGDVDTLKAEIDRLTNRKKALENNVDGLKDYMRHNMEALGITKVKTAKFTITLGKPGETVAVEDPKLLPKDYQRITISADKTALKKPLQAGEVIQGASLVQSKPRLTIK